MWIIIENEEILKVSVLEENSGMIFIQNCPEDLINNPSQYEFVNGQLEPIIPEVV